jgi:hypothetical protein
MYRMKEKLKRKIELWKREIFAVAICLLFVSLFYTGIIYSTKFVDIVLNSIAKSEVSRVNGYISGKEASLLVIVRSASTDKDVQTVLENDEYMPAFKLASGFVQQDNLGSFGIFDKFGMGLTRGIPADRTGDYIFQTSVTGRELLMHNETSGIREAIVTPLTISAAERIEDGNTFLGAITAGDFINNAFAGGIKSTLGITVAFFDSKSGIIADNFNNPKIDTELNAYFKLDQQTKDTLLPSAYIKINGQNYFAFKYLFTDPGLTNDGYIVFIPQNNIPLRVAWPLITSLLLLCIFLLIRNISLFKPLLVIKNERILVSGIIFTLIVVFPITYFLTNSYISNSYKDITNTPQTLYNSVFSLNPASGIFTRGDEQKIQIIITTGGETINAFDASLSLDPNLADIVSVDTTDSFCSKGFLVNQTIDKTKGTADVSCVVPNPDSQSGPIVAFTLVVEPKAVGRMDIAFDDASTILANDGLGTNVLRQAVGGSYETVLSLQNNGEPVSFVFSPSHPDPAQWYNSNSVDMLWQAPSAKSFAYSVDLSSSTPSSVLMQKTQNAEISVNVPEGINYFHLLALDASGTPVDTLSYPLKIDNTPPAMPDVSLSSAVIQPNEVVRITFSASDALSGLQHNFYVSYDGGTFLPTVSPLNAVFTDAGTHNVTIRAYDNAGNFSDKTESIQVQNN